MLCILYSESKLIYFNEDAVTILLKFHKEKQVQMKICIYFKKVLKCGFLFSQGICFTAATINICNLLQTQSAGL